MQHIGDLFELRFDPDRLDMVSADTVVLRMDVTFTARATGKSVSLPVVEVLAMCAGRHRPQRGLPPGHRGPAGHARPGLSPYPSSHRSPKGRHTMPRQSCALATVLAVALASTAVAA
jgi:hypothetical protein